MDSRYDAVIKRHTNEIIARLSIIGDGMISMRVVKAVVLGAEPCVTCQGSGIGDIIGYPDQSPDVIPCAECDGVGHDGTVYP